MKTQPQSIKPWQRAIHTIASTRFASRILVRLLASIDRIALSLTLGQSTLTEILTGLPIVRVTTIGARTGRERSVALLGVPDGGKVILVASNFGQSHHPDWFHNLLIHPQVIVNRGESTQTYFAQVASDDERQRLWDKAVGYYRGFASYQKRAMPRQIPIIILSPIEE